MGQRDLSLGILLCFLSFFNLYADEIRPKGANAYQIVTGDRLEEDQMRWNTLYKSKTYVFGKEPSVFLKSKIHWLQGSRALDIPMGEGRNAVFLAERGFEVDGVDLSEVATRKSKQLAKEKQVNINSVVADLHFYKIKSNTYHVIVSTGYFQKSLISQMKRGLKKNGVVIYENRTIDPVSNLQGSPIPRDFILKKGEVKELFRDFEILEYEETEDGRDSKVSLVARKIN